MTPRLTTLLLCDFAQVREQLLFVNSGGVSRVMQSTYPARPRLMLAAVVHLPADSLGAPHHVVIKLKYPDDATVIATIDITLNVAGPPLGAHPGEGINMPQVLDLNPIVFAHPGQVDVQVSIDDEPVGDLTFWMVQNPATR